MANAQERIYRTPDGTLVSEANVKDARAGGAGTVLAYAVGDEMSADDAKSFGAGKAAKKTEPQAPDFSTPNTIEVSNPAANPVTNPATKTAKK